MPTTEAGRALLSELAESPLDGARYAHQVVLLRVAAIEAEAAAKATADLRAELAGRINDEADIRLPDGRLAITRAHAVAIIEEKP